MLSIFWNGRLSQRMDPNVQLMLEKVVAPSNAGVHMDPLKQADIPDL